MAGIHQIDAQILGVPKLVIFDVRCDKGVASGGMGLLHAIAAGSAAHRHPANFPAAGDIPHARAAQPVLDPV